MPCERIARTVAPRLGLPVVIPKTREHRNACFEERRPQRQVEINRGLTILTDVATDDDQRWVDLMGLSVYSLEEDYLGELRSIVQTGSNDVYVVKRVDGTTEIEVLVPALASVVKEIDLDKRLMRVDLPEGL